MKIAEIALRRIEVETWIAEGRPKAHIYTALGCKSVTLDNYLRSVGIEYHGNIGARGFKPSPKRRPTTDFLVIDGPFIRSHLLKERLIRDGLRKRCCQKCGLERWLDQLMPLELHHVNGNHGDNRDENLEILCPNCHSLTPNNSGKACGRLGKLANPPDLGSGLLGVRVPGRLPIFQQECA